MATANVNVVKEGVNLELVKQLIAEQEPKWPIPSNDEPLYVWKIPKVSEAGNESQVFGIGAYNCKLKLNAISGSWHVNFYLDLTNEELYEDKARFHSFQYFVCKIQYRDCFGVPREKFSVSTHPHNSFAQQNETRFIFNLMFDPVSNVTVEVGVEPSTYWNYVSPTPNAVVGKIENYNEKREHVRENRMLVVSPVFDFGSADPMMIVRFWRRNENESNDQSLMITLHEFNVGVAPKEPFFEIRVVVTIYSQTQGGNDLIYRIRLEEDIRKSEYQLFPVPHEILLSCGCLENDTLYYRVTVEPITASE